MNIDVNNIIVGAVEYPPDKSKFYGNRFLVSGWVYAKDGDEIEINLYSKDEKLCRGTWGITRHDVYKEFDDESAYESGFFVVVQVNAWPYGEHDIDIVAIHNCESHLIKKIIIEKIDISKLFVRIFHKCKLLLNKIFNHQNLEVNYSELVKKNIPLGTAPGSMKKGNELLKCYIEMSQLKSSAKVLEVGCGLGRFALPLTRYLETGSGSYTGLEVLPHAVNHLKKNISPRFSNFDVSLAEVYNNLYNPNCSTVGENYIFPYKDNAFDFVFLQSVFTHLTIRDMENYLMQIARVLKNGGSCLLTYLILNEKTEELIKQKLAYYDFKYQFDGFRAVSKEKPEIAIAYEENYLRKLFPEIGLSIVEPIYYGSWRGDKKGYPDQDVIIAEKI